MLKLGHFEKKSEIPPKFRNVVVGMDGNISWTHHAKNAVLRRVEEESNIALLIKRKKVTWSGHTLCMKCLLKYVTERND